MDSPCPELRCRNQYQIILCGRQPCLSKNTGLLYSPNGTVQSEDLHIGAGADSGGAFFFSGNIDDVSIWNTALDEAAILNIKDNGVASAIPEATSLGLLALGCLGLLRRRRS
jgi:hypothetical protein